MQTWPQPVKVYEIGPMFRYDRPQAGRFRQFWQFDIEAIGDPGPAVDAEIIELGMRFYTDAGLTGVKVLLNSIGDAVCRPAYIEELTAYYRQHIESLPPTERDRLERNVLRLPDSKDPAMASINAGAPRITDRLCDACAAHFGGRPGASGRTRCAISTRSRARPWTRLLHPYRVRVLYRGTRGPAAGSRRGRAVRRARRAPRWPADTGHRLSVSGSTASCSRSRSRAQPAVMPWRAMRPRPSSSAPTLPRPSIGCASRRCCAPMGSSHAPSSVSASSASSSRQLRATRPTSRSSSATSSPTVRYSSATSPPATQKVVGVDDLAREVARAHQAHHHGS
jgi:hypothetical protein